VLLEFLRVLLVLQGVTGCCRMNMDTVARLGIPKGKMLGELKAGSSVTLAGGRVVQPSDVRSRRLPAVIFCNNLNMCWMQLGPAARCCIWETRATARTR